MKKFLFVFISFMPAALVAQHSMKIGTQIPIQYAVQYDYQFHKRWSGNAQVGVLTKPYDNVILDVLNILGVDQEIVSVLKSAFEFGVVSQVGANYHFKKNYVGAFGSWVHLAAAETPVGAVEAAFNVNVRSYPTRPRQSSTTPVTLTLASDLYNIGVFYGRQFTFSNPRLELHTEFGFGKTLDSSSYVESPQRSLESLSAQVNSELHAIYLDYGFLLSINVFFVYKFGSK